MGRKNTNSASAAANTIKEVEDVRAFKVEEEKDKEVFKIEEIKEFNNIFIEYLAEVVDGDLNVRAAATKNSTIVKVLKQGDFIEVKGIDVDENGEEWAHLGGDQWCMNRYLKPLKAAE